MANQHASSILENLASTGNAYVHGQPGSRENLIELSRQLIASLEIPSEFLQRSFWAEPAMSAHLRLAVDLNILGLLRDAGPDGLDPEALAEKIGVQASLFKRLMRHLVAMHVLTYSDGKIHATTLSNGLAAEDYQRSIMFCYDVTRPSFNNFPDHFKRVGFVEPTTTNDGPFNDAFSTPLPFFDWLNANPPNIQNFASFMASYRAGKPNWFDEGFYPVKERLIEGFDASIGSALLVDVGGGRGHDMAMFAAEHKGHPGDIVLQDQEAVIGEIQDKKSQPFIATAHDFYTPQPVIGARAYSLHSILHDWDDEHGSRILENLKPALKPGYSRVLLNEIVLSEEEPTLAATSMDMMMLGHLNVRERTEAHWRTIIEGAGLRVINIYRYPGSAESLIEAELAEAVAAPKI
ncbi:putative hydroxyindole O-methyltransferase [Microdochium trichocladiopsis]|uniref:Hydroxyindole O-methyltransferase n=1 Tax=Microdochium trichocladiopsis TaxID=1682393 RepID=A0A9P9BS96_9PEZI|nr:putative hydroxyindole O-methyltransferase [Microdochium trichocladiopsis]KAH7033625.1 putative hydroxyindole O-methyltransferase [Microdochium trichocladiopsis]